MNLRKAHRSSVNQTPESNIVYIRILFRLTLCGALYEDGLSYKINILCTFINRFYTCKIKHR